MTEAGYDGERRTRPVSSLLEVSRRSCRTVWCGSLALLPTGPPVGFTGSSVASQRASEGETRLLRGLLGLAAESAGEEQLVPLPPVVRLSQARGHLCARKLF
jgi:hypothetical protein